MQDAIHRLKKEPNDLNYLKCSKSNEKICSIQGEGAFGGLKEDMGFRRFLTRGTANVKTEITLLCLSYNIQKLHNKTIANRQGQFLHEIKAA